MSDSDMEYDLLGGSRANRQRTAILGLMMKGAFYGMAVFAGLIAFIWIFIGIGALLPPESKEALDPTPASFELELPAERTSYDI